MNYIVYSPCSSAIAEIPNSYAQNIINQCKGFFTEESTRRHGTRNSYKLTEDKVYEFSNGVKLLLNAGTVLYPLY